MTEGNVSLPRTLETEVMDSEQEVQEYMEMDHLEVNTAFVDDLVRGGKVGPRVLDLGCGTAQIPILLCQRLSDVEVMGVDMSIEMLEAAKIEIELGGATGRIQLEHADCKQLTEFQSGSADSVISNTLLHHLAEPVDALRQAVRLMNDQGRLFIRDLVRPETAEDVERLVNLHAGQESEYAQQLLRQSLHAALTLQEMRQAAQSVGIPADAVAMTSDRHCTIDWMR
ncbi:class I SAM-dependent methyltransferase [Roseiconus nitratireducens]|uniref:Class I SAM-dependent methyltransferase n=1 Tax=Roseiconus nitratireducens TaxID=2605748 RepID=A0A5M6CZ71_9BACT|nr:class I SAM-dependent methyltransferase [Roseiconus nitratireducens]KAA5540511.1 class I SAM-dependent methyltransferase [Roseiconus nitratireducens]